MNQDMELPFFDRMPLEPPQQQEDKEIFYPKWSCFCCHDYGVIYSTLVKRIIPGYKENEDKWPMCQNPGCNAFNKRFGANVSMNNFDTRFSSLICQKLDLIERQGWQETVETQRINRKLKEAYNKVKMSGYQDRTENQNQEIEQRKQEIENYDWAGASKAYLGDD